MPGAAGTFVAFSRPLRRVASPARRRRSPDCGGFIIACLVDGFQDQAAADGPFFVPFGQGGASGWRPDIRALRLREQASQPVFARHLDATTDLVSQRERGEKRPQGASLKLPTPVEKNGLGAVA